MRMEMLMFGDQIFKINTLIDLHSSIDYQFRAGWLREDRADYMKYLIELELLEEGHSLKGIANCSKKTLG